MNKYVDKGPLLTDNTHPLMNPPVTNGTLFPHFPKAFAATLKRLEVFSISDKMCEIGRNFPANSIL